jgi:phosphoglycolate phosphatase
VPTDQLVVGFDLDMTLVDSADGITATLRSAVRSFPGGEALSIDREQVWPWVGLPLEPMIVALVPQFEPAEVIRAYRARYAEIGVPLTRLLPGAVEAIRAVHAVDGRVLVVSAKVEAGVHEVLTAVGLDHHDLKPDLVVGGLFGAAKGARLITEEAAVYVGDHPGDVEAARVAGAFSVAVATGPQTAATLVSAGADVVLDDLVGFPNWLSTFLPAFNRSRASR